MHDEEIIITVFIVLQQLRQSVLFFSLSGDQTGEQRLPTSSRGFSPSHQLQQLLQRLLSCVLMYMSTVWVLGVIQAICLILILCTIRVFIYRLRYTECVCKTDNQTYSSKMHLKAHLYYLMLSVISMQILNCMFVSLMNGRTSKIVWCQRL